MMTLHPKVIDLTLDRMHRLLAALGQPQEKIPPVIHIAGTNGKGSTQAMIRAGLEALINRPVFYQLADLALAEAATPPGLWSGGVFCPFMPA